MVETPKGKPLTEMQLKFLIYLFDDSTQGDERAAMDAAGYSKLTSTKEVVEPLADLITELAVKKMAAASVKASFALIDVLKNPSSNGAANKIKAAEAILSRAGAAKPSDQVSLNIPDTGLVILPAKRIATEGGFDG